MTTSAAQMRAYTGPAVLSFGFRPFFLGASLWAALIVALWLPMLEGSLSLPTAFDPLQWHVHELLYGFLPAVVAGFLLTAVPNWTGRLPILGTRLLALFVIWIAGRAAVLTSELTGLGFAAALDLSFLVALIAVIAREIIAGNNTRNLRVLALITLLLVGNAIFYLEAAYATANGYGTRLGIAAAVLLISLVGGRIIPSFTRNWLVRQSQGRLPVPFNRYDGVTILGGAIALVCWIAAPFAAFTAAALLFAGALHAVRLARWAGDRTSPETLVQVLHAGYAFVPLGFFLVALSIVAPDILLPSGALHAWTVGAIGLMTLAVMTRASLGHSGRELTATGATRLIYAAMLIAAVARLAAGFDLARMPMLHVSAAAWVLAYGAFAVVYWPMLTKPRLQGT
jgi:uncharacterized protein involved in response to NO